MRHTIHQYHYAIRAAKQQETESRKQRLAESCSSNNTKDMWQELKHMNSSRKPVANVMDGACTSSAISEVFAKKYQALYSSVPTSPQKMDTLTEMVNGALTGETIANCKVFTSDVVKAVTKLNRGKRDGSDNFYSDHIINASPKLYAMLAMLINCMVAHGYSPHKLLKSTIVPIPKDNRSSTTRSDNYRAIALCNSICKLIDIVFIDKYSDALYTSQLQFGFKKNHSTVLCTSVLLGTVSYFTQRNSDVYACMLDASKAFDRVHYGKLLKLLLHRKMPAVVVRFLIDNYKRQCMSVEWNSYRSMPFDVQNGVKQGGVLSPLLFSIYIDELLCKLERSGLGCYIENTFLGALGYADDITLVSPSTRGPNEMPKICELFAVEYHVTFNESKTVAIQFGSKSQTDGHVVLNGNHIKWKQDVKHLGNIVSADGTDTNDCILKRSQFTGAVNKLIGNFGHVPTQLLCQLFTTYCCSFYGSQLWGANNVGFKRCTT